MRQKNRNPKILFFCQGGPLAASSRYRVYQYLPFLRSAGWKCFVAPGIPTFLHRAYFFSKNPVGKALLSCFLFFRRVVQILRVPFVDIAFIQKPLLPAGWMPLEPLVSALARKTVFDFDDAIFLPSPFGNAILSNRQCKKRFDRIIRCADLVLAGNGTLARAAHQSGGRNVQILPTAVDTDRFARKAPGTESLCTIGWMGSPTTAMYLQTIEDILEPIAQQWSAQWVFVGAIASDHKTPDALSPWGAHRCVSLIPWDYETEVARLASFDIFVSPLQDTPWEQGKCGLKILAAMSVGLPVVASAVGVHTEIIQDGCNGFLVRNADQWKEKLSLLLSNPDLRRRMGQEARRTVQRKYSLTENAGRLMDLLAAV